MTLGGALVTPPNRKVYGVFYLVELAVEVKLPTLPCTIDASMDHCDCIVGGTEHMPAEG